VTIPAGATVEQSADRIDVLKQLPLLSYLPPSAVVRIDSTSSIERRHPGETILAEGSPPGDAYIIWEGRVQILHHDRPRRIAGAGELIGDVATLHSTDGRAARPRCRSRTPSCSHSRATSCSPS
jgi:CRP-like cAMP-binding protein